MADLKVNKVLTTLRLLLLGGLSVAAAASGAAPEDVRSGVQAGPLYSDYDLTLEPGRRVEALGPLFHYQSKLEARQWGVPPVFSYTVDDGLDSTEMDFLYPLVTYNRFGSEYYFQVIQWLSFSGGKALTETNVNRFTLFPFYFQQRSDMPDKNYTALFPVYGRLKNRFFRSETLFVVWPAYVRTSKRDVVTDNVLFPLFHVRHGGGVSGWQFWPLVGWEHKAVSQRTNNWNDLEVVAGHKKFFAVWPFFFNQTTGMGTTNEMRQDVFVPFYSVQRSELRRSFSVPWPLGYSHTVDREQQYEEWAAPWPFIVFARGKGKTVNRILPLFSRARSEFIEQNTYLWPIYKYRRITSAPLERERTRILFFVYSDVNEKNTETGLSRHRNDFWPFYVYRDDSKGNRRLQILAPLEPILPSHKSIERNYSPLWSLWRQEKNGATGASSQSLLWNLYRHESSGESKKCSLLFGLFQYQSGSEGRRWRLFHRPAGKRKQVTTESETAALR